DAGFAVGQAVEEKAAAPAAVGDVVGDRAAVQVQQQQAGPDVGVDAPASLEAEGRRAVAGHRTVEKVHGGVAVPEEQAAAGESGVAGEGGVDRREVAVEQVDAAAGRRLVVADDAVVEVEGAGFAGDAAALGAGSEGGVALDGAACHQQRSL